MSLLGAQHIAAKMAFEILTHNSTHTHTHNFCRHHSNSNGRKLRRENIHDQ